MDIRILDMDGLEATEKIMAYKPTPILALADLEHKADAALSLKAFEVGILDIMKKPSLIRLAERPKVNEELIKNVKLISQIKVITHPKGRHHKKDSRKRLQNDDDFKVIAI